MALVVICVAAVALAMADAWASRRALEQARADQAAAQAEVIPLELAARARAVLPDDPLLGLALAAEAASFTPAPAEAIAALVDARREVAAPTWQPVADLIEAHPGGATAVAFAPGGSTLAIAGFDRDNLGRVLIWDVELASEVAVLDTSDGPVNDVAFSPDGTLLATAGAGGFVRLWSTTTWQRSGLPLVHRDSAANAVAFTTDGRTLLVGGATQQGEGLLQAWDVGTRRPVGPQQSDSAPLTCLAVAPDGTHVALCGRDPGSSEGAVQQWDPRTGQPIGAPLLGHYGELDAVAYSPDSQVLVSGGADGTVRLWDAGTGRPLLDPIPAHTDGVRAVAVSPDGALMASAGADATVRLWDPATGTPVGAPMRGRDGDVVAVAFSADSSLLAAANADGTVQVWQASPGDPVGRTLPGQQVNEPLPGHEGGVSSVTFTPDGTGLVSAGVDVDRSEGVAVQWDLRTGTEQATPLAIGPSSVAALSPDGTLVAAGAPEDVGRGSLQVWRLATGEPASPLMTGHEGRVTRVAFNDDATRLASASMSPLTKRPEVRLWDPATGEMLAEQLELPNGRISGLAFSPDGTRLAVGVLNGRNWGLVQLLDARTAEPVGEPMSAPDGGITSLAFAPDGQVVVTGGADGTVRRWDSIRGAMIGAQMEGHRTPVLGLAVSPDGTIIASASRDGELRLWDARTGQALGQGLRTGTLGGVAFSPDGGQLATAGRDGIIRLWDVWRPDIACDLVAPFVTVAQVSAAAPTGWTGPACELR